MEKDIHKIEEEVNKTLESLEGIEKATPDAFFFTRLKARMDRERSPKPSLLDFLLKPQLGFAILGILALLNTGVFLSLQQPSTSGAQNRDSMIEQLASEYQLEVEESTYY
ncbi:hypothetical protein N9933_01690 [bacterium]|nr:hypothetical protein [bacterium]